MKTKGKTEEHVITGFVSTAAQYPDHTHEMRERDCMHAGKYESTIEPPCDERQFNLDNYLTN